MPEAPLFFAVFGPVPIMDGSGDAVQGTSTNSDAPGRSGETYD